MEFSLSQFVKLRDEQLVQFCTALLNTSTENVKFRSSDIHELRFRLESLDTAHLVFALELGAHLAPNDFISAAPPFLVHPDVSVACSAARILHQAPKELIDKAIVDAVSALAASKSQSNEFLNILLQSWATP